MTDEKISAPESTGNSLSNKRISPLLFGAVYVIAFQSLRSGVAAFNGRFFPQGNQTGFIDDLGLYTNSVTVLVFAASYLWIPAQIQKIFDQLNRNDIINSPIPDGEYDSYADFVKQFQQTLHRRIWFYMAIIISTVGVTRFTMPTYIDLGSSVASTDGFISLFLSSLWAILMVFFVISLVFHTGIAIYFLWKLFRQFRIDIKPLHADGAGGLSVIGNFALSLNVLTTIIGLLIVITPITRSYAVSRSISFLWTPELLVSLGLYVLISPVVFFIPLALTHRAMIAEKRRLMSIISDEFQGTFHESINSITSEKIHAEISPNLESIHDLKQLHKLIQSFPTWPINTQQITNFLTSFISPILLALATDFATNTLLSGL